MFDLENPEFPEGTDVVITEPIYDGVAVGYTEDGMDYTEAHVDLEDGDTFEVVSVDYERGLLYNLRLNGERDGHDYIRVWNVRGEHMERVR